MFLACAAQFSNKTCDLKNTLATIWVACDTPGLYRQRQACAAEPRVTFTEQYPPTSGLLLTKAGKAQAQESKLTTEKPRRPLHNFGPLQQEKTQDDQVAKNQGDNADHHLAWFI